MNWPVVLADTQLEPRDGARAVAPVAGLLPGHVASHLRIGGTTEGDGAFAFERGMIPTANAYGCAGRTKAARSTRALRRPTSTPTATRVDSNLVFAAASAARLRVAVAAVDVTVPPEYAFGDSRAESDLFERKDWGLSAVDGACVVHAGDRLAAQPAAAAGAMRRAMRRAARARVLALAGCLAELEPDVGDAARGLCKPEDSDPEHDVSFENDI